MYPPENQPLQPQPPQQPIATALGIALRRLELCTYAVQEIHTELEHPEDPEHKADLLLATENLAYEVIDLLNTAKMYAWGPDYDRDLLEEDQED